MSNILDKWKESYMSHYDKYNFRRINDLEDIYKAFGFRLVVHIKDLPDCLDMDVSGLMDGCFYDYMTKECGIDKDNLQEKVIEFFNDAGLDDLLTFYAVPYKKEDDWNLRFLS